MLVPQEFFDLEGFEHQDIFPKDEPVWTPLDRLKDYVAFFFQKPWVLSTITGHIDEPLVIYNGEIRNDLEVKTTSAKGSFHVYLKGEEVEGASVILPGVYIFDNRIIIGSGTIVESGTVLKGPVVIGKNTEVRQGAYIRGDCLIGNNCVVGHTTEMKSSIMLDGSKAGHFAYIEDPDGTLIEFVETLKVPVSKRLGWYIDLSKRRPEKSLPSWIIKTLRYSRVRDKKRN